MKSLSRAQNRTLVSNVDFARLPGRGHKGLASARPLIYIGLAPSKAQKTREAAPPSERPHGAAGMKEPRKPPPQKPPTKAEEKLDEELEESFPASDPPSNTPTSAGGPERSQAKRPAPRKPSQRG